MACHDRKVFLKLIAPYCFEPRKNMANNNEIVISFNGIEEYFDFFGVDDATERRRVIQQGFQLPDSNFLIKNGNKNCSVLALQNGQSYQLIRSRRGVLEIFPPLYTTDPGDTGRIFSKIAFSWH